MTPLRNEHTIAASCEVSGRGYWSGREVLVRIDPAPAGTGVRMIRADLPGQPTCPATVDHARDCRFRTNLESGAARFQMVEHLMAALAALEIDNCLVSIDAEELPGLDGSSRPYVDALRESGLIVQALPRRRLVVTEPIRVELEGSWAEGLPSIDGETRFEYRLHYDEASPIGDQTYRCRLNPSDFVHEIAPARTFVTQSQADQLRARGVASHVTHRDLLVFGADGPIENRLRFRNECARHKTLDMIGDLSLVAADLVGHFVSHRGGHRLNAMLARALHERSRQTDRLATAAHDARRAA